MPARLITVVAGALAAVLLAGAACAAEIEGIKFPDIVRLGDNGPELVLNGAGLRTRFFFKVYMGALYLPQKTASAQSAIAGAGAKRIAMHILREIEADEFMSSLDEGLKANHAPGDLAKIEPQLKQLQAIFDAVKITRNGDVILLDYIPGDGTRVTVNGESRGLLTGEDFIRALLRVWLGEQPADASLKKAMLGG